MTRVRLSQLGPAARAQAEAMLAAGAGTPVTSKAKRGRAEDNARPCPGHCHTGNCRAPFPTFAAWLRHCLDVHQDTGRWDIDL
jgi:hypothetical protein